MLAHNYFYATAIIPWWRQHVKKVFHRRQESERARSSNTRRGDGRRRRAAKRANSAKETGQGVPGIFNVIHCYSLRRSFSESASVAAQAVPLDHSLDPKIVFHFGRFKGVTSELLSQLSLRRAQRFEELLCAVSDLSVGVFT